MTTHPLPQHILDSLEHESDQEDGGATVDTQTTMRLQGKCAAEIIQRPTAKHIEESRSRGDRNPLRYVAHFCDKNVEAGLGRCREHYLRDILRVSRKGQARGRKFRPFKDWQVPLRSMSNTQRILAADTKRLPISSSYEEWLQALSTADPTHPLSPIYEKPVKSPRRSRRS